jgi:mediator of DNA damage checkpoint protein 1
MLGERGLGRAVLDDVNVEPRDEEFPDAAIEKQDAKAGDFPSETSTSVVDEMEVEDVVGFMDGPVPEGSAPKGATATVITGEQTNTSPKPRSKRAAKPLGSSRLQDNAESTNADKPVRGKSTSPVKWRQNLEGDEDEPRTPKKRPVHQQPQPEQTPSPRNLRGTTKRVKSPDNPNEPGPSTRKRKVPPAADSGNKPARKTDLVRRAKRKIAASPTDSEDSPPTILITDPQVAPKVTLTSVMKEKYNAIADAIASLASPTRSPRRVPSVLITTSPVAVLSTHNEKNASPSSVKKVTSRVRTESFRVAAAEIPVSSTSKRGRLVANNEPSSPTQTSDRFHHAPTALVRTPSKRSAANKANDKLHSVLMPDLLNYQQEMRRAKGKGRLYDRSQNEIIVNNADRRAQLLREEEEEEEEEEEGEVQRGRKRRKISKGLEAGVAAATNETHNEQRPPKSKKTHAVSPSEQDSDDAPTPKQARAPASKRTGSVFPFVALIST